MNTHNQSQTGPPRDRHAAIGMKIISHKIAGLAGGIYVGAGLFSNIAVGLVLKAFVKKDPIMLAFGAAFSLCILFTIASWFYFLSRPENWKLFGFGKPFWLILTASCYFAGIALSFYIKQRLS
jgi:hypothetical protein